jgi:hypothetical protein
MAVYSDNHTKHINTLREKIAELLNVEEVGIYKYHWALN